MELVFDPVRPAPILAASAVYSVGPIDDTRKNPLSFEDALAPT